MSWTTVKPRGEFIVGTVAQNILGIGRWRLNKLVKDGHLTVRKFPGQAPLYVGSEVRALAELSTTRAVVTETN